MSDVEYCPRCGEPMEQAMTTFTADWLLNCYRMPFDCVHCGYEGELIRRSVADDKTPRTDLGDRDG